jgi:hypothetical protein
VEEAEARLDELAENPEADEDGTTELEILDEVTMVVDESLPRDARGTPETLERAAKCRSAVTIDHYGRVHETTPFIALEKSIIARVGAAVVWRGEGGEEPREGAKLVTVEAFVKEREKEVGPKWRKTPALGTIEEPVRKPTKTRTAKPGELEALTVYKRLSRIIEGNDPFARDALKKALQRTTPQVRAYAAALMDNGATPDALLSKELDTPASEVASAREALGQILSSIR